MLSFQLKGISKLIKRYDGVKKKLDNRKRANAQAIAWVDRWIQKNFQLEGRLSMGGSGWKSLSPATIASRRKGKKGKVFKRLGHSESFRSTTARPIILQDTGTMKKRWKHLWTATKAVIQSGVNYAKIHHLGSRARNLAARKITPTRKQVWPSIKKIYKEFMKGALG